MTTTTTFSILFWLKVSRANNGKAPLYARITVNRKRAEISLKRRIETDCWNPSMNRVNGTNEKARTINEFLCQVSSEILRSKNELKTEGKIISAQAVKARYLKEDEQHYTLNDIIKYHNLNMEHNLKWGTQKNYFTTQKYIATFLWTNYKVSDIHLKQLDYSFILKFENYLRSHIPTDHQKTMGNNIIMKHIERLRK